MADIRFKGVNKLYPNGLKAVNNLNLDIRDGEFLVLVGPSGCGKSTVLRMIAGLEDVSSGDLSIGDQIVNDMEPKDRDIAMVFQSYALYPHMSVAENIGFPLRLAKVDKAEMDQRVQEAARILELTEQLDRKPAQLSGGQRQRVAMGRAIVRQPSVYLLDEPLSNLDAKLRDQTRTEMVDLQARLGVTTVYVTHDQVEAMTMGNRVAVLKDGELQQVDTPRRLYSHPANLFVAGFIGTPAMNFLDVDIKDGALAIGDLPVPVTEVAAREISGQSARSITIGARPEHLTFAREGLQGSIVGVEDLGPESIVRVLIEHAGKDHILVVRGDGETEMQRGDYVKVAFQRPVHLFGPDGRRLGAET